MRVAYVVILCTVAIAAAGPDVPTSLERLADGPTRVVLYSVDPSQPVNEPPDTLFFGRYRIRGSADVTDPAEQQALLKALAQGAREAKKEVMLCFEPHHGLRVEKGSYAAEFVICFECLQVQAWGFQPGWGFNISATPQSVFDDSLHRHNLPLAGK